ncbi:hypothetical protein Csa_001348 [Cucumis sativus]|uniref:Uncharacterized protein n=1 Tax=Cucumis sativus TaxID=3659 RepID=A0A0A0LAZ7_CUCSA|nr:hypothetical protein Csa_001348 [Cucumis sativus]
MTAKTIKSFTHLQQEHIGPWSTLLDLQVHGEEERLNAKIDDEDKGLYGVEIGKGIIPKDYIREKTRRIRTKNDSEIVEGIKKMMKKKIKEN